MDIFDKYSLPAMRHRRVVKMGMDPFGVRMGRLYSTTEAKVNGRRTILVGTNNYLGLTFHKDCTEAAIRAIEKQGTGTTGSRIANGTYASHVELERIIASFLGRRSAMVFPTGYQANLGMISGLAGAHDIIFVDADSHASIYDGCRLSGATVVRFKHNDPADLDRRLARHEGQGACKLIVVEGIYSMVGDTAPLRQFAEVKRKHGAYLLVDEAHSLGVMGAHGRGAVEEMDVEDDVDFVVGTFSKSLGGVGGFGASSHPSFDVLRFCARPYMYTASASPATVAGGHRGGSHHRARTEAAKAAEGQRAALARRPHSIGLRDLLAAQPDNRFAHAQRRDVLRRLEPLVGTGCLRRTWRFRQAPPADCVCCGAASPPRIPPSRSTRSAAGSANLLKNCRCTKRPAPSPTFERSHWPRAI